MSENIKPTAAELDADVGVDLSVSQLPELANFRGGEMVHIVSNGRDFRMEASKFAAALAGSEVSMADLNKKADKVVVDDQIVRVDLIDAKKANKTDVDALGIAVSELDLSKASRTQVSSVENRVNALEVRAGNIEAKATLQGEEVFALNRRVAAAELKLVEVSTLAQKGVDDAARAQIKANQADASAQEALGAIAAQTARIDAQVTTISRIDGETDANRRGLSALQSDFASLGIRMGAAEVAQAQLAARVATIENELPTFVKKSELISTNGRVSANTDSLIAQDARITANRVDIDKLRLDLVALRADMDAKDEELLFLISGIESRLAALTTRVDQITAGGGSIVPEVRSIGTVSQPGGYTGNNYSCSIVNSVVNSYGNPLSGLMFHLEIKRSGIWQNARASQFTDLDSGASVQFDVTLQPGEFFEYRCVLKDKYRPGWVHVIRTFEYTAL